MESRDYKKIELYKKRDGGEKNRYCSMSVDDNYLIGIYKNMSYKYNVFVVDVLGVSSHINLILF